MYGSEAGFASPAVHVDDIGGNVSGALCGLLDIARNVPRCPSLLVDGRGDRCRNFRNPANRGANLFDRLDRILGSDLHFGDLTTDFVGRLGGLRGECLHFRQTAKPLPESPARAASIVAFRASKFVCFAIDVIRLTTSPIRMAAFDNSLIRASVTSA